MENLDLIYVGGYNMIEDKYKKGYEILLEYFDCIPEEERGEVDKRLREIGL
jgi:hypothetical protein